MFLRKRIHDSHTAEELTQDVFVSAFKYLHTYKKELSSFYTWLCTIATNTASKRPYNSLKIEVDGWTTVTPESLCMDKQELDRVMKIVSTLPQKQQRALFMKLYEGSCYNDIGYALGVSSGYAKKLVFQAKKHIRRECDKRRELSDDGGATTLPTH